LARPFSQSVSIHAPRAGRNTNLKEREEIVARRTWRGLAELHHIYIGAVERGERKCSIDSLSKIAKGLNVNVVDLFVTATRDKPQDISKIKASIMKDIEKCSPAALLLISDLVSGFKKLGILSGKKRTLKDGNKEELAIERLWG
jgi:hypothetical protein